MIWIILGIGFSLLGIAIAAYKTRREQKGITKAEFDQIIGSLGSLGKREP